jgi:hypothetical protein
MDSVNMPGVTTEGNVSILGVKRKYAGEIEIDQECISNEISVSPKRAHIRSVLLMITHIV